MKKNKRETKRDKINNYQLSKKIALLYNVFSEGKGIQVKFKKRDKIADGISHWVPVLIEPPTFMEDMVF